jgi:hypothetical protein
MQFTPTTSLKIAPMPNGDHEPKNWSRLLVLLSAFHDAHGRWPTRLKLGREARTEIRRFLGGRTAVAFELLLPPLQDDDSPGWVPILVQDDAGHSMEYGRHRDPNSTSDAEEWLSNGFASLMMQGGRLFVELGPFAFGPGQRERFRQQRLWMDWARRYPELFDSLDLKLAESQAPSGFHFFEWLAAILLFQTTGYLSLVEKYQFAKHARKQAVLARVLPEDVLQTIRQPGTQAPDLFVFAPDYSDWFFCEVKGPKDRLRKAQLEHFQRVRDLTLRPIRLIRFQETAPYGY